MQTTNMVALVMETMQDHEFCGIDLVLTNLVRCLLNPYPKTNRYDPKDVLLKGMTKLRDIVTRNFKKATGHNVRLTPVIKLAILHIENKDLELRNIAQDLIMECFKVVGFEAIEPEFQGTSSV